MEDIGSALANAGSLGLWAFGTITLIRQRVMSWPVWLQGLFHAVAAPVFAVGWYASVIILLGWSHGSLSAGFSVQPFIGAAFIWQMFQGMGLYGGVAALAYSIAFREELLALQAVAGAEAARPKDAAQRVMARIGDEWMPLALDEILLVSGAGDYAELTTANGRHLSRKSLSEFEALLPEASFVRVHRSHIVNLEAVLRAEPAGNGCMSLQLLGGESVKTSRAGAQKMRALSI
ncbi:LytR/AlgR family response regulator transcription factor [Maricaulis parjimensis]|uniref:LytR/AlgR family response regulator transcription factor n=1 Tax=Maricaulis parjimensis TaxID=144023 RepID=UPI001EEF1524|nr:LytTR family DNA-binding domain-containing protein [Maricaulis parjimensis]